MARRELRNPKSDLRTKARTPPQCIYWDADGRQIPGPAARVVQTTHRRLGERSDATREVDDQSAGASGFEAWHDVHHAEEIAATRHFHTSNRGDSLRI